MFFARSQDANLFIEKNKDHGCNKDPMQKYMNPNNLPAKLKNTSFAKDISCNKIIRITTLEQMLLMLHWTVPGLMRVSCWTKKKQMRRLMEIGSKKVEKTLNMNNILA